MQVKRVKTNHLILQFYFYRENATQTKRDNYTNVPNPSVFLAGLRGGGMTQPTDMIKVDLTVDVTQT